MRWLAERTGTALVVGGGLLLLASLWLPWYVTNRACVVPAPIGGRCFDEAHFSAWEAFQTADIVLAVLAVAAVALALAGPQLASALAPRLGVSASFGVAVARLAVAAIGWSVIALSLFAIERPTLASDPARVPDFGYLGALLAGGAITGGGWWPIVAGPATRRAP